MLCVAALAVAAVLPVQTADAKRQFGSRTLQIGSKGRDVRVLQDMLTKVGHRVKVDGRFGPGTARRVKAWESRSQLEPNGVVTPEDAQELRGQVAAGAYEAGGARYEEPAPPPPAPAGAKATIAPDGTAVAPAGAPEAVKRIIAAGNEIHDKPYVYGGGHGRWNDRGYDCSGSVSYALHGADLLDQAMPSGGFMRWEEPGRGQWVTIYANEGHMYMVVAGLRFDTSGRSDRGSRWTREMRSSRGYVARHPAGL